MTPAALADEKAPATIQRLKPAEFEQVVAKPGVIVLDVRTPAEFKTRRLKGAVLADVKSQTFEKRIAELDKTRPYAVYCAMGPRSTKACELLRKAGFTQLYELDGGILAWEKAGKPVDRE
ncbi:MAG: rhodanese-like domain-containing protein [Phycisphaerae bacterium]|nr:rhodanese-like domain-containing protein [Tepidisphaeraceae bacterium]